MNIGVKDAGDWFKRVHFKNFVSAPYLACIKLTSPWTELGKHLFFKQ